MSDSEPVDVPSEAAISRALRDAVIAIHRSGATENLTVKRVRARVETELRLPAGFLKNQDWKQKSNNVIHDAVDKYCGDEPDPEPAPAPALKSKAPAGPKANKPKAAPEKQKPAKASSPGLKRKAPAPAKKPQKRRKTVASSGDDSEPAPIDSLNTADALSDAESEPPKKLVRRQKKVVPEDSDADDDGDHHPAQAVKLAAWERTPPPATKHDDSDSSLSSVIDESPAKKKRQKKSPTTKRVAKPKSRATKPKAEDNPDAAEIKRLQGWLVKCGIRKVWSKELAKCDTAKDKIRHLKEMLRDAGMEGKFSNEKAARIKEQREFAKDLEEIKAGELAWGKAEDNGSRRPQRRLARTAPRASMPDGDDSEEDHDDPKDDDSSVKGQDDDAEIGSREDEHGSEDSD